MRQDKSIGQLAALVIGVAYLAGGIVGFVFTGFGGFVDSAGTNLFGIFAINPFHNVVHIGVGALLLLASRADSSVTEGALLGVGSIYIVATIAGFTYAHIPVIALVTASDPDNYLHLITGATAILVAILSAGQTQKRARRFST